MILRRTAALSAAALATSALGLIALAGCSNSTSTPAAGAASASGSSAAATTAAASNAGLTDAALRAAYTKAANGATAMHMKGSMTQNGQPVTLDLQLNKDNSTDGTIGIGTASLPVKAVGGVYYMQFTPSFIQYMAKQQGSDAAAFAMFSNKWVSSNSTVGKSMAQSFSQFMTFSAVTKQITDNADGDTVTAAGTTTLNGQTVAVYNSSKGSKLYFAASGPAYLLRQVLGGSDGTGTADIVWNQPTTVTPPPASQIFTG